MHTLKNTLLALMLLAPGAAMAGAPAAPAGVFHTTGGQHKLQMQTLSVTPTGMKVRFTDSTKVAFNGRQRSATVTLRRMQDTGSANDWARYEGQSKAGRWGFDMTMQKKALTGARGAIIGLGLTQWDGLLGGPRDYSIHFQLKN